VPGNDPATQHRLWQRQTQKICTENPTSLHREPNFEASNKTQARRFSSGKLAGQCRMTLPYDLIDFLARFSASLHPFSPPPWTWLRHGLSATRSSPSRAHSPSCERIRSTPTTMKPSQPRRTSPPASSRPRKAYVSPPCLFWSRAIARDPSRCWPGNFDIDPCCSRNTTCKPSCRHRASAPTRRSRFRRRRRAMSITTRSTWPSRRSPPTISASRRRSRSASAASMT